VFTKKWIFFKVLIFWLLIVSKCYALPFTIIPTTTLPTTVYKDSSVKAYYTVTNNTAVTRVNNYVEYLPPNVIQIESAGPYSPVCNSKFTLAPRGRMGDSCILELQISGAVDSRDPDQTHHLFVCFPGGISCAGTTSSLNVNESSEAPLITLTVTPSAVSIMRGSIEQFSATGSFSDGSIRNLTSSVNWISSNTATASINSAGVATGLSIGTTNISAQLSSVTSNTALLTVTSPVLTSISISPLTATIYKGNNQLYAAIGHYSDGSQATITNSVTWNSSNTAIATINSGGFASSVGVGTSNISATLSGITSNLAPLVVNPPALTSITLTPSPTASVGVGFTLQFTATGHYTDNSTADLTSTALWLSSSQANATVNTTGLVSGVAAGSTNISASSNGISSSVTAVSVITLTSISVTPATTFLITGGAQQFTATGTFSDSSTANITSSVTWTSSNTGVATINASGVTSTVAVGTTNIKAAFNSINSNNAATTVSLFAYISGLSSDITVCTISATDGTLKNCSDTGVGYYAFRITVNPSGKTLYLTNYNGLQVAVCGLNGNGTIASCGNAVTLGTYTVGVSTNASGTTLYVATNLNDNQIRCNISSVDGTLSGCGTTALSALGANGASGVAINSTSGVNLSYFVTDNSGSVYLCALNSNGTYTGSCTTSGSFTQLMGVAVNSNSTYIYLQDYTSNAQTQSCILNSDGTLGSCLSSGPSISSTPSLPVVSSANYLYILVQQSYALYSCSLSPTTGAIVTCNTNNIGISGYEAIAVH
jgi:hypothetical protein